MDSCSSRDFKYLWMNLYSSRGKFQPLLPKGWIWSGIRAALWKYKDLWGKMSTTMTMTSIMIMVMIMMMTLIVTEVMMITMVGLMVMSNISIQICCQAVVMMMTMMELKTVSRLMLMIMMSINHVVLNHPVLDANSGLVSS